MTQVFAITPASQNVGWWVAGICLIPVLILAMFGYVFYSLHHTRAEVSPEGLRIRGDLYGRAIPAQALVVDQARQIDLIREPSYRAKWRTNGIALPGYSSGWFRLRNGQKALLFVTKPIVVYVPTRNGYSVLMSVQEPDAFLYSLKQLSH